MCSYISQFHSFYLTKHNSATIPFTHYRITRVTNYCLQPIPSTVTYVTFCNDFNRSVDNLPSSILHIRFQNYNQRVDHLPPNLKSIKFGQTFNQPIDCLPPTVESIRFKGSAFDHPIDRLPSSLTLLKMNLSRHPVDRLPPNLLYLQLGQGFNRSVCNLPPKLKHLTFFGNEFNQTVDNLPFTLTRIHFSDHFNNSVDHLPPGLTHLRFGIFFNQRVDNLPKTLTYLTFGTNFDQTVENLPPSIISLSFGQLFSKPYIIGPNVQKLVASYFNPPSIPRSVVNVRLFRPISGSYLPSTLTHLSFRSRFNSKMFNDFPNLIYLKYHVLLDRADELPVIANFPPKLKVLKVYDVIGLDNFPKDLEVIIATFSVNFVAERNSVGPMPPSLTKLYLHGLYNSEVPQLSPNLTHLSFGDTFDRAITYLPPSLTHFKLGFAFSQPLPPLPPNLMYFCQFSLRYPHPFPKLPPTVHYYCGSVPRELPEYVQLNAEKACNWYRKL